MSWSVSAIGKAPAVAAKVVADLNQYKCVDPEESVKQAVGNALAAALAAQDPNSVVRVNASGHQSGGNPTGSGTLTLVQNMLTVTVEPVYGFVE